MGCIGAIAVAAPSAIAAAGLYFLDRYHYRTNMNKEVRDGLHGLKTLNANFIAKVKGETTKAAQQIPKFAPEFDGLHCFETLVAGH